MDHLTFLTDLPPDIITNILARLPIKTIINCQCVCKSWFQLLKTPEFISFHLSKTVPGLIVYNHEPESQFFRTFDFEDQLDHELEHNESRYKPVMKWDFPHKGHNIVYIEGTANGLLCLREICHEPDAIYICNPITQEYIELPCPAGKSWYPTIATYGFGISKMRGQYKVVRIFQERELDRHTHKLLNIPKSECQVYTVGTGAWRSIDSPGLEHEYDCHSNGAFLNGKLHWIMADLKGYPLISCFDLETEVFNTFSLPPLPPQSRFHGSPPGRRGFLGALTVLEDCLCFCDNNCGYDIVIWVMKEYGFEKSWQKKIVVRKSLDHVGDEHFVAINPLKVFKNGDILMLWGDLFLFYYSAKTKSTEEMEMFPEWLDCSVQARVHASSFVSLRSFTKEIVKSFRVSLLYSEY